MQRLFSHPVLTSQSGVGQSGVGLRCETWPASARTESIEVIWASSEADVREAQSLRYRVFAQEMGARLTPVQGAPIGLDIDHFDAYCDHLLVRARDLTCDRDYKLVGTYRVLPPAAAARAGGLYTDTEFDLTPLSRLRPRAVELGRSCVHPAWRSGSVIMALWTALAQYMAAHQLETMIGCASVGLNDGGQTASKLWGQLRTTHLVAPQWQVRPHVPLWVAPGQPTSNTLTHINMPPLIKGYLRCGARLLGPPALDAAFNTADLPMMLQVSELTPRYRKHFLGA
ncbi:MAG: GNAT family N-acetyltransferase [Thiobacillus sp.]